MSSSMGENALWMPEVRRERPDWFQLIERQQKLKYPPVTTEVCISERSIRPTLKQKRYSSRRHSCQLRTETEATIHMDSTKLDKRRLEKCCLI